ncbi:MAG: hypothetical protein K8J08_04655 [Thermoanaerobaculia bacterium]|nr:hypothetical protein [Thermoanaerobaculia bacterium]
MTPITLGAFNHLHVLGAGRLLRTVCGARRWTEKITAARPYNSLNELLYTAHRSWWSLGAAPWKEAFSIHGSVVERLRLLDVINADNNTAIADQVESLRELEHQYREKFEYPWVVSLPALAAPEDAQEVVDGLIRTARQRLANDSSSELRLAAEEQARFNRIGLEELIAVRYLNSQQATQS